MPKSFCSKSLRDSFLISFLIVLSDQISKCMVLKFLNVGDIVHVLPFFNFVRVENKGVTFGLLSGVLSSFVLTVTSLIIIMLICWWMKNNVSCRLPASLIVGGAIGNVIDRIAHNAVIDFLDFHLLAYHWPAFNIADSAIVIGTAVLFLYGEGKT
jgi:signal peptidase II